jgi:5-methylcytosine-specific restriction endonuclease McrA
MDIESLLKYAKLYAESASHPRADYMREYMANRYHQKRQEVIDRLGGRCARCGTRTGKFHLDHKDRTKKTMRASDLHSVNDKKFENEIKNLQILCEDCHKDKTNESWDYGSNVNRPRHGSYWYYRKYGCRCQECINAYKEKQKEWRYNQKKE